MTRSTEKLIHAALRDGCREHCDALIDELRRLHAAHDWQYKMAGERLRRIEKLEAQRDALLEKIKAVIAAEQSEGSGRGGFVNTPPTREHQRRVAQAWQELHAAIKAVKGEKE